MRGEIEQVHVAILRRGMSDAAGDDAGDVVLQVTPGCVRVAVCEKRG